jgi:hypothetical protein
MIRSNRSFLRLAAVLLALAAIGAAADSPPVGREIVKADSDWRFSVGDVPGQTSLKPEQTYLYLLCYA